MPDAEVAPTLSAYFRTAGRWPRTAVAVVAIAVGATLLFSLLADEVYTARATLLPEPGAAEAGGISAMLMDRMGFFPGLVSGPATPGDIAVSLLQSRMLAGRVVDAVGLVGKWEIDEGEAGRSRIVAVDKLLRKIRVAQDDRTLVRLQVQDKDRVRAADIANAYLDELDRANQEFSASSAGRTRRFVEKRLEETRTELARAQDSLQAFQREHGALAMDEQTRTTVEVVAKLQGEIEGLRARRDALRFSLSDRSTEVGVADAQIGALERRVEALVGPGEAGRGGGVLLALGNIPELAAEYARLYLAVETQATVYGMLAQQFEQAKIEEARNTSTIRILDRATPPMWRTRPKLKLNLAVGGVLGAALALVAVLLLERAAPGGGSEGDRWRELVRRPPFFRAA